MQTDYMERELPQIVTLMLKACVLLALVPFICNSQANSEQLDKPVSREIANKENPGFISIDCGSIIDYLQEDTGIWYKTDKGFVETGENHVTSSIINLNYLYFGKQLTTLRCFPEGDRNCYTLKPKEGKNKKYMIRAFFSYGNYDGKNQTQSFELYLGVNLWKKINFTNTDHYTFTEIIHTPSTDTINVCLVKTGPIIPCISSLELRLLNNSIYQNHQMISTNDPEPLLESQARIDVGPSPCLANATSDSDAPPILNAFEIYKLMTQLDSPTSPQDVGAIMDIKSSYQVYKLNWQGDPCLPTQYRWEGLVCKGDTIPRITSLNLSSSKLTGKINISFSYLTELEFLDLSYNELEGPLPEFLAHLPNLKVLNLTGNKLSSPIPKDLKQKADNKTLELSVAGNPDLCMTGSCKKKNIVVPLVASFSALFLIILIISLGFRIFKRQKALYIHVVPPARFNSKKRGSLKSKHHAFSYNEILNITDNFKTIIGEGGFGKVYIGILQDHTQVAVKMLSTSSKQGYKEFQSEVQLLMIVHHRNLVSLIGYCDEGEIKALIYEYMTNGNLQQYLLVENSNIINWTKRLKIAVDAAHGLDYLHNGCKPPIIHRDLKSSNILLDENLHAKIADFGLSRAFGNDNDSHISTRPAGTFGYVDPQFQRTGNTNKKNDIYSFGIILFELITGKKALIKAPDETIHILQWVIPLIKGGDIQNIIDARLQGEFNINSAWKVVEVAMSCISQIAAERPDINQILVELKECLSLEIVQRNSGSARDIIELTTLSTGPEITPSAS
ncbi:putative transferase, protein kinase RLK-Pelle-LRR-I-1 family [Medicago truncatula]|uniref:non-specific serine/threonine protein kinase n=1 Tax=Medicago truncatula TaxID=3880 RepID=A0A396GCC2_MEDTR|nr:putative transferase, protein kinase RLK-Pelle-LRR-I-1 family [Medicago truncatula]